MMQVGWYISKTQGPSSSKEGFLNVAANLYQNDEPEGTIQMKRMKTKLKPTFGSIIRENSHENDIDGIQNGDAHNSDAGQKVDPTASKLLPLHDKLHHPLYNLITVRAQAAGSKEGTCTHQQLRAAKTQELDGVRHRTDGKPIIALRYNDCSVGIAIQ